MILVTNEWVEYLRSVHAEIEPGKWAPARPLAYPSLRSRLRDAWAVLRGKADAITWAQDVSRKPPAPPVSSRTPMPCAMCGHTEDDHPYRHRFKPPPKPRPPPPGEYPDTYGRIGEW